MEQKSANNTEPWHRRRRGCLIAVGVVAALCLYSGWQLGEPGRRADRVRAAIAVGMPFDSFEALLKAQGGRCYVSYRIPAEGGQGTSSREDFVRVFAGGAVTNASVRVTFMSQVGSPGRTSFEVRFESNGVVSAIGDPYGWD